MSVYQKGQFKLDKSRVLAKLDKDGNIWMTIEGFKWWSESAGMKLWGTKIDPESWTPRNQLPQVSEPTAPVNEGELFIPVQFEDNTEKIEAKRIESEKMEESEDAVEEGEDVPVPQAPAQSPAQAQAQAQEQAPARRVCEKCSQDHDTSFCKSWSKECKFFSEGYCRHGKKCHFYHEKKGDQPIGERRSSIGERPKKGSGPRPRMYCDDMRVTVNLK